MIPVGDYARDAFAVLLLLMPLGMAWDLEHQATGHGFVIPVTLLSILSLALPYLKAASVLPSALTPAHIRSIRLLANAPYLIAVVVTLVVAYVGGSANGEIDDGGGVGTGLVIGLAGVLLAAQGRTSEQRGGTDDHALWRAITVVIAGIAVVLAVLSAAFYLFEFGHESTWSEVVILVLDVVIFTGVPWIAVRGLARNDSTWRDVAVVLGGVGLLLAMWAQGADETIGEAWSLRLAGPQFLFWPALGAAAAAAGLSVSASPPAGAVRWVKLPVRLFQTVTVVAVLALLLSGMRLMEDVDARGQYITGLVLSLIVLMLATFGRNALVSDMRAGRSVALGAAVGLVFVVIVEIAVLGLSGSTSITTDVAATLSIWFLFAVVSAVALTAPRSVQEELDEPLAGGPAPPGLSEYPAGGEEPRRHGRPGARSDGPDESGPPPPEETGAHMADESIWEASNDEPASTQPPQDEHSDPSVFTAQTAANPNTPPNVLAEIATHRPELRPLVAHNPSSYPGLLGWLDQLGDPAVDYVLRRRSSR